MTEAPILKQIDRAIEALSTEVDECIDDLMRRVQTREDIQRVENRINDIDEGITLARRLIDQLSAANN